MSTPRTTPPAIPGVKMSPAMIDAAVIQLKSVIDNAEDIPDEVRTSGTAFVESLDKWSEKMKAEEAQK